MCNPKQTTMEESVFCIVNRYVCLSEVAKIARRLFHAPVPATAYLYIDEGIPLAVRVLIIREFKKHKPHVTALKVALCTPLQLSLFCGYYQWIQPAYQEARAKMRARRGQTKVSGRTFQIEKVA